MHDVTCFFSLQRFKYLMLLPGTKFGSLQNGCRMEVFQLLVSTRCFVNLQNTIMQERLPDASIFLQNKQSSSRIHQSFNLCLNANLIHMIPNGLLQCSRSSLRACAKCQKGQDFHMPWKNLSNFTMWLRQTGPSIDQLRLWFMQLCIYYTPFEDCTSCSAQIVSMRNSRCGGQKQY